MNKLVAIFILACIYLIGSSSALTLQIEPKSQECFFNYVEHGKNSLILYQVIRGGLLDINVKITDPRGNSIFERLHFDNQMKGKYSFTAGESGAYKVCFNNEMSRFTAKVVTFSWDSEENAEKDAAKGDSITPMDQSVQKIERVLQSVIYEQKKLRFREQSNRDTSESTNARVVWWTIAEVVVLVVMAIGQIWYLRKWFETRSSGRV
ncbi:emp24/gp25L/p24 family protein [Dictyostelium purpureum]|uniref:Emp24/gp25L/p24 family protein n=1 Tax=Dictyostelium purpureum TaxID=5786 RepID=F0ZNA0_DICPU|nr:emp24/gp25L/p24 family protein [Dictyostelium purpureum]EGC34568.1 emp24/gp25L/p24 family protein [Dictyostelium purpureum]|eukprot:XP_003288892.1 emp24/gp25L/p24 family protein [Dictyostelium purpureum]